ncbi:MAG: glycosyltransferase family 39 protein [Elioraea sp.]|nr:glycosyltransferase family 39 protein [Elioraea sp.]
MRLSSAGGAVTAPLTVNPTGFPWLASAGLMAVAAALRLYGLTATSLWIDEAFGLKFALPETDFLAVVLGDIHPPLYYALLGGWLALFGVSEWTIRSLSVVFAVATVPLVVAIGRRFGDDRRALVAGLLFALFPSHIQYSSEGRMYALLVFIAAVAMLGAIDFARFATDPRRATQGALLFALAATAAVFTQMMGALLIPCCGLLLLIGWALAGFPASAVRPLLVGCGALAVGLLAWAPVALRLIANAAVHGHWWFPQPSFRLVAEVVGGLLGQKVSVLVGAPGGAAAAALVAALALVGAWALRKDRLALAFLFCCLVLPFLLSLAASLLFRPVFIKRIHLWTLIPLAIVLAHGVFGVAGRLRVMVVAGLGAILLVGLYGHHVVWQRPDWRGLLGHLSARLGESDLVLAPGALGVSELIRFYAPAAAPRARLIGDAAALRSASAEATGREVWLVSAPWHDRVPRAEVVRAFGASHVVVETVPFHRIDLLRLRPAPGAAHSRDGAGGG